MQFKIGSLPPKSVEFAGVRLLFVFTMTIHDMVIQILTPGMTDNTNTFTVHVSSN